MSGEHNDMQRLERLWRHRPPLRMQDEADALDDPEAVLRFVRSCVVTRRPEGEDDGAEAARKG